MPLGQRKDPYTNSRFVVEIEGLIVGGFAEVAGLRAETQIEEYREGGVNDFVHRLPKETRYPNLVLKRGVTDSDVLWNWHRNVVEGNVERKSGYIVLLDGEGNETWRLNFIDGYPVKWDGPELRGDGHAVAIESIEIAHNGILKA